MKVVKSSDYPVNNLKVSEMHSINSESHLCEVIENADGVPFKLIFGPKIGEGYYINVGEGVQQLLGIEPGDLTEKLFQEMIEEVIPLYDYIPADPKKTREKFINGDIIKYKAEVLVRTPGGDKKWISDSSLPLKDDETGNVIGCFGILFDINERKNTIVNLAMAKEKADESDRLKKAFLQNISHEVRTPLNAIVGFSTLLCEREQDCDQRQEFLDIINKSTNHFLEIMDNILEISRIDANAVVVNFKVLDPDRIMNKVFDLFSPKAEEKKINLCLTSHEHKDKILIMADEAKLMQIMTCLLSNATKFTIEGKVEFGYTLKEDCIEFHISDTGIGIEEKHKPKIFNRFYQVETSSTRSYPGTGLGLSISKAYIELMGGTIWFASQPGCGSVFCFSLPYDRQLSR